MSKEAFVFPGQGSQYEGMGKLMLEHSNPDIAGISRLVYQEASDVSGINLEKLCLVGRKPDLDRTRITQPAIVATSIVALRVLRYLDRYPDVVAGHSLGEFSAFVAARSLTFEQSIGIVVARGRYMESAGKIHPGRMAALIGFSLRDVEAICQETGAEVANVNEPLQIVISGEEYTVLAASKKAREKGRVFPLDVSVASHSSLMVDVRQNMSDFMEKEMVFDPQTPLVLNLTGEYATSARDIEIEILQQLTGRFYGCKA